MSPERQRLLALNSQAQVHIINVDNLRWLLNVLRSRARKNGWPYDVQEPHKFSLGSSVIRGAGKRGTRVCALPCPSHCRT